MRFPKNNALTAQWRRVPNKDVKSEILKCTIRWCWIHLKTGTHVLTRPNYYPTSFKSLDAPESIK